MQNIKWFSISMFTDVNECLTTPCRNGGTCLNMAGSYSCACSQGWKGRNCSEGRLLPLWIICLLFGLEL